MESRFITASVPHPGPFFLDNILDSRRGSSALYSLVKSAAEQSAAVWRDLDQAWNIFIGFFKNSTRLTREILHKNRGSPVIVVHGQIDIAYPIELAHLVVEALVEAEVPTEFVDVPKATHYACVTAPNE